VVAGYNKSGETTATSHNQVFYALGQGGLTEPLKLKGVKKVKRILVLGIVASLLLGVMFTSACITQAGEPTSTEELKAIARRYIDDLWSKGNLAVADEIIAADFVDHSPHPGETPDREGIKQGVTAFQTGFSDYQFVIEDMIAEGDRIAIRQTFRGIHTGEFAGASPTGKEITMTCIVILRAKGGKIVDRWANVDDLGFLIQLGVIPPPG